MITQATNSMLGDLLAKITNELLVCQPDFQRRLVWNNKDKNNFIKTVLEGYPFPEIYLATGEINQETGARIQLLVDGQQRITTLYQYFRNSPDLKLDKDIIPYAKLSQEEKENFLQYSVVIRDLGKLSLDDIKMIFQRINSTSYGLNAMEINNSKYAGAYKDFNEDFSKHDFFEKHKFFSPKEIHRMDDILFCLNITTTILSTYYNLSNDVEEYLKRYDDEFPESIIIANNYNKIFNLLDDVVDFDESSRIYNKADFFTLFVEIYKFIFLQNRILNDICFGKILSGFYKEVNNCNKSNIEVKDENIRLYYSSVIQGSSSRSSRINRGKIIREILERCEKK